MSFRVHKNMVHIIYWTHIFGLTVLLVTARHMIVTLRQIIDTCLHITVTVGHITCHSDEYATVHRLLFLSL